MSKGLVSCVGCGRADVPALEASMSGDGWLCPPCSKRWQASWLPRRRSIADLPDGTADDLRRAQRARAWRTLTIALGLVVAGLFGMAVLRGWLMSGGVLPALFGAAPLLVIVGVILGLLALSDLRQRRE